MKILYFTRGQSPHDLRFLNALAGTEHQTAVVCLEGEGDFHWPEGINELHWEGEHRSGQWLRYGRYAQSFARIVNEFQPDVIHAGPIQRVAFIAALANVHPLLSMSWGSDLLLEADQNLLWQKITRQTLKRTDMLAADCQTVVNKARAFGYTGPVAVFPWGVDLDHFKPGLTGSLRKRLGWEKNLVFLSNRAFEPLYGVDLVAQAFAEASRTNDQIRLLLFGKGSQEAKIRSILHTVEANKKVYFGGFANLEELPDVYRSTDYYLSASHSDGSSVSLMEALACGKPAVLSDIPSNQEWVEPGKTGWLFRDDDPRNLAELMLSVKRDEEFDQAAHNARLLAEERADWKKNFPILVEAYRQLAERK